MALGGLGWSPETFWAATILDFTAAMDGRRLLAQGGQTLEDADIAALRQMLSEV